ncbi:MAG: EamA family transporter [Vicinamibacterales bacterium]
MSDSRALKGRATPVRADWLAYAALAGAVVAIAWSAIFVRWADIPGSASAFYRVLIASVVLLPWRVATPRLKSGPIQPAGARTVAGHGKSLKSRRAFWLAVAAGVFFALDLALFNTAVMRSSAATTSLLAGGAPVFVGLGSWLLLRKAPRRLFWAGLAASLTGSALMIWPAATVAGDVGAAAPRQSVSGDLMAISAAFCFAAYILAVSKARESIDTVTLNTVAIAASTLTLLPICVAIGAPLWGYTRDTWFALLWLGVVSQVGAYLCIAYALGHLPATVVSIGLLAQAPLTALLAATLLGERLTPLQLLGGILVLAGIYVVNRAETPAAVVASGRTSIPPA